MFSSRGSGTLFLPSYVSGDKGALAVLSLLLPAFRVWRRVFPYSTGSYSGSPCLVVRVFSTLWMKARRDDLVGKITMSPDF